MSMLINFSCIVFEKLGTNRSGKMNLGIDFTGSSRESIHDLYNCTRQPGMEQLHGHLLNFKTNILSFMSVLSTELDLWE